MKILKNRFLRKNIPKRKCLYCHEHIHNKAEVCPYCRKFLNGKGYFSFLNSTLALVVALVSVVTMSVPFIRLELKPDNSEVSLSYIDRADVMISIIASNKGTRLAVLNTLSVLTITILDNNQEEKKYDFTFRLMNDVDTQSNIAARNELVILEGSSKVFYYYIHLDESTQKEIIKLSNERDINIDNIKQCEFNVLYMDFEGKTVKNPLNIFDRSKFQEPTFEASWGSMNCLLRIPEQIRYEYKLFLP